MYVSFFYFTLFLFYFEPNWKDFGSFEHELCTHEALWMIIFCATLQFSFTKGTKIVIFRGNVFPIYCLFYSIAISPEIIIFDTQLTYVIQVVHKVLSFRHLRLSCTFRRKLIVRCDAIYGTLWQIGLSIFLYLYFIFYIFGFIVYFMFQYMTLQFIVYLIYCFDNPLVMLSIFMEVSIFINTVWNLLFGVISIFFLGDWNFWENAGLVLWGLDVESFS